MHCCTLFCQATGRTACHLWARCAHKWVEEQERHYCLQAALGCVLQGSLSRAEPWGGTMPSCSLKTWRWQPVPQGSTKVHSAWDASLKCTPFWPFISGFTVEGENTLVLWEVLVGEGIQTINSYPEKYVAHIRRGLSHEVSNFYWKFFLDMTTIAWIYTSFIEAIHTSSSNFFFLPGQHLAARISWAFFTF